MTAHPASSRLEELFLTVDCPTCGAAPGDPCTYRGRRGWRTHTRRQTRAISADERKTRMTAAMLDSGPYRRALALEPDLRAVERTVRALAALAPADRPFCASCLWEDVLKPLVSPLVGWERGRPHVDAQPPAEPGPPYTFTPAGEFILGARPLDWQARWDKPDPEPSTPEEAWLRSTEAYDAVTDPLLALLDAADPGLGHGYPGGDR